MKKVKPNLKKMLDEIEWIKVEPMRGGGLGALASDAVSVGFTNISREKPDLINRVVIRLGSSIIEELNWKVGDKIVVMNDKHNLMNFLLVKTETGTGYKLSKENPGKAHRIQFKWPNKNTPLPRRSFGLVDYYIRNKQLIIFTINPLES